MNENGLMVAGVMWSFTYLMMHRKWLLRKVCACAVHSLLMWNTNRWVWYSAVYCV